jgi:RNA polymerase sigma-70 factor (ECF subfamily)
MAKKEQTDQELVRAVLSGRDLAFEELVRRHQDAVFGLALSMARNREDATDMAQEAFIRVFEKLDQYNPDYPFRPWVLRICANRTKNLFRKRAKRRQIEQAHYEQQQRDQEGMHPDYQQLEEALNKLPPKLGTPLRLKYIESLSYEEVAHILHIGVSAAKMRVLRAKKLLMEHLSV